VDARADQFSFCVALYEALHGVRPLATAAADELPQRRRVSTRVQAALRRGLSPEPDARFATMRPLLDAITPRRRAWPTVAAASVSRFDLRMECLDQRWRDLRALIDVLATQPGAAEHALDAIAGLAPVEACLDVEVQRRVPRPTAPPEALRPAEELLARTRAEL